MRGDDEGVIKILVGRDLAQIRYGSDAERVFAATCGGGGAQFPLGAVGCTAIYIIVNC